MTDPRLAAEFPWLRRDPSEILGDARPRSIGELLGKQRLWLGLYRDWLTSYNSSYLDGLEYLAGGQAREVEYASRLGAAYPAFYRAAGELKDYLKSHRGSDPRSRFPWVSGDPGPLLGNARPKDFDALRELGEKSDWMALYRGWLAHAQPFGHADGWLDWLLEQGTGRESWERALDPTVEAFAHEVGRLKERLRETHGNKAERIVRRVADAAERVGLLEHGEDAGGYGGHQGGHGAGGAGHGGMGGGGSQSVGAGGGVAHGGAGAGGGGGGAGGGGAGGGAPKVGGAGGGGGAQGRGGGAGGGAARVGGAGGGGAAPGLGGAAGGGGRASGGQAGGGVQRRAGTTAGSPDAAVTQQVQAQIQLATPLVAKASELGRWLAYLAPRFTIFGGYLGEESDNLHGYRQLVDGDGARLGEALQAAQGALGQGTETIFAGLAMLRNAVYTLAWDVDLACQNYYGGWPHQRLGAVAQALPGAGSPQLCHEAGPVLRHLAHDVDQVYGVASGLLDVALQVITAQVQGYRGWDSAEPWGTHEVVGARAELSAITQQAAGLAGPEGGQEDQAQLEQACQASFGIPYLTFSQVADHFR